MYGRLDIRTDRFKDVRKESKEFFRVMFKELTFCKKFNGSKFVI